MNTLLKLSAAALILVAGSASAGIATTAHDFSALGWNNTGEICAVCHTPHNGNATITDAPLWDHAVTSQTFTPYTGNGTLDGTAGTPAGVSKLCLSCHDGATGLDAFGGATGVPTLITGNANFGTDLSNDHPITIGYAAAIAAGESELNATTATVTGIGTVADMLYGGNVECASCHDVHDDTNGQFLLISNAGSALCLACHNK